MGIVNVTPDSFSDGGRYLSAPEAVAHGRRLAAEGADLVDIGGESTRPGAGPVDVPDEIARVVPVIKELASAGIVISIDTSKPEVAEAGMAAGAVIVNDVTACGDPEMLSLVAASRAGLILMHMKGTPRTMQNDPVYDDVVGEVGLFLSARAGAAESAGVDRASICIDPGIGFGKNLDHNLTLLNRLSELKRFGYPIAIGTSRKGFLGSLTGRSKPEDRDLASAVATALAIEQGADVIRVHNVPLSKESLQVTLAIVRHLEGDGYHGT